MQAIFTVKPKIALHSISAKNSLKRKYCTNRSCSRTSIVYISTKKQPKRFCTFWVNTYNRSRQWQYSHSVVYTDCVKLLVFKGTRYFNALSVSGFGTQTSSSRFACFYERYMWIFCYYTDFTMRHKCVFLLHSGTRTTAETSWWVVHRLEKTKIRKYHLNECLGYDEPSGMSLYCSGSTSKP